MDLGRRSVVR